MLALIGSKKVGCFTHQLARFYSRVVAFSYILPSRGTIDVTPSSPAPDRELVRKDLHVAVPWGGGTRTSSGPRIRQVMRFFRQLGISTLHISAHGSLYVWPEVRRRGSKISQNRAADWFSRECAEPPRRFSVGISTLRERKSRFLMRPGDKGAHQKSEDRNERKAAPYTPPVSTRGPRDPNREQTQHVAHDPALARSLHKKNERCSAR